MRHGVSGYKLGRNTSHRRAMWRNMAVSLFTHGQIQTTLPKAKSVKPFVERLLTLAKKGDLASRRRVAKLLGGDPIMVAHDLRDMTRSEARAAGYTLNRFHELQDGPRVLTKLFDELGPQYAERNGGYTRIIKLGIWRIGDAAPVCLLQLVSDDDGGPRVSGQLSRRREKADRRQEFAAGLRKKLRGGGADAEASADPQAGGEATATAEAPAPEGGESSDAASTGEEKRES